MSKLLIGQKKKPLLNKKKVQTLENTYEPIAKV